MGRQRAVTKEQVKRLKQYRDMTDEEFDEAWELKAFNTAQSEILEKRIQAKWEEFEKDYDIDDLKINDRESLRGLIQAIIALEDYEQFTFQMRTSGLTAENINLMDKVGKVMSDLRNSISKYQDDLKITRKIRRSEQETSVLNYLEELKKKAREYYESKMMYVLCPKCNMLLSTVWFLYPNESNTLELTCHRTLDDGSLCGHKFTVNSQDLIANRGTNKEQNLPDSLL